MNYLINNVFLSMFFKKCIKILREDIIEIVRKQRYRGSECDEIPLMPNLLYCMHSKDLSKWGYIRKTSLRDSFPANNILQQRHETGNIFE